MTKNSNQGAPALTRMNVENGNFLRVIDGLDKNVRMYARMTFSGGGGGG